MIIQNYEFPKMHQVFTNQVTIALKQSVLCNGCDRSFRRPRDLKRHKCLTDRAKPISEQCTMLTLSLMDEE